METLTIEHFVPFIEVHRYLGYLFLFLMMMLEGEVFLVVSATLAHLGAFRLWEVFVVAFAGVVLGNILWYYLGMMVGTYGIAKKLIARAERAVDYFLPHFREKPSSSIFISKFIYGVNHAVVFMSGVLRIDFMFFLKAETLASVAWVVFHTTMGYLFGYAAIQITHKASLFVLILAAFVIGFILLQKLFTYIYERHEHKDNSDPQR